MKLKELFEAPSNPSFISKIRRAIDPTAEGKQNLAAKTNALVNLWSTYRGETNAVPNAANIEHWVKNNLGLDDPNIWAQAIEEFSEENPNAGQKYKEQVRMDPKDISKFFNKLVQIRLMNPNVKMYSQRNAANAAAAQADVTHTQNKKNAGPAPTTGAEEEKNTGLPQHPVFAQSGIHMNKTEPSKTPEKPNPTVPMTPEERTKAGQVNNPGVNPEPVNPNKPAMLKPDDKNAVDWQKVRSRFPEKPAVGTKKTD